MPYQFGPQTARINETRSRINETRSKTCANFEVIKRKDTVIFTRTTQRTSSTFYYQTTRVSKADPEYRPIRQLSRTFYFGENDGFILSPIIGSQNSEIY